MIYFSSVGYYCILFSLYVITPICWIMPHEYYSSASVFHATTFCGAGIFPGIIAAFACASDFYFRFLFTCLIFLSYTRLALGRYLNHHLSPRLFRKRCPMLLWMDQSADSGRILTAVSQSDFKRRSGHPVLFIPPGWPLWRMTYHTITPAFSKLVRVRPLWSLEVIGSKRSYVLNWCKPNSDYDDTRLVLLTLIVVRW